MMDAAKGRTRRPRRPAGLVGRALRCAAVLLTVGAACGQATAAQVVVVLSSTAAPYRLAETELTSRLTKLGHTVRRAALSDLVSTSRAADRSAEVFVGIGTQSTIWLTRNARKDANVAYCMVADPNALGRRGAHTCGVTTAVPAAAQFRLIAEALPRATSIGMLYRAKTAKGKAALREAAAALPKGIRLEAVALDKYGSPAQAIEALLARRVDIVWTTPDATIYNVATVRQLLLAALRKRTPVFGFSSAFVRAGALLGIGIDPRSQGRQAADVVADILRARQRKAGRRPATTRPAAATRPSPCQCRTPDFLIAINLVVARKLVVELPPRLLQRAGLVYGKQGRTER